MEDLKYFRFAKQLNQELSEELKNHEFHFRGNLNSFSLISLSKSFPEIGFSNIKTIKTGKRIFKEVISKDEFPKRVLKKGRKTREKELQAWIINNAINNDNKLYFDNEIKFICSEMTIKFHDKKNNKSLKVSNDILGFNKNNEIVIIELKSSREKKRLEEQIGNFIKAINQNIILFENLVKLLNNNKKWNKKIKSVVVWPALDKSTQTVWQHDIIEYTYQEIRIEDSVKIKYDKEENIIFKKNEKR